MVSAGADGGSDGFVFTDMELDVHDQLNAYRSSLGLEPLEADPFLGEIARGHSDDMLASGVLSHDGFDARADEMIGDGALSAGENVAFNQGFEDPATTAVDGWIDSPDHHANIVGDFTHGGVGVAVDDDIVYLTHLFALRD